MAKGLAQLKSELGRSSSESELARLKLTRSSNQRHMNNAIACYAFLAAKSLGLGVMRIKGRQTREVLKAIGELHEKSGGDK